MRRMVLLCLPTALCSCHRKFKNPRLSPNRKKRRKSRVMARMVGGLCLSPFHFADCSFPGGVYGGVEETGPKEISEPPDDTSAVEVQVAKTDPDRSGIPQIHCRGDYVTQPLRLYHNQVHTRSFGCNSRNEQPSPTVGSK